MRAFNYFIGQVLDFLNASFSFIEKNVYTAWILSLIRYFIEQALLMQEHHPTRLKQALDFQCPFEILLSIFIKISFAPIITFALLGRFLEHIQF
jgi:hypothetical protein